METESLLQGNSETTAPAHVADVTNTGEGDVPPTETATQATETPTTTTIDFPENWKEGLPAEYRDDPSMAAINDIPSLAKSYIHGQKAIGADKILVPNKYDDGTQFKAALHKLGMPEKRDEYKITPEREDFDEKLVGDFTDKAFELGVFPKQAQALMDWFDQRQTNLDETFSEEYKAKKEADINGLKKEWGPAFEAKIDTAIDGLEYFVGDNQEDLEYIHQHYGSDIKFVKLMNKVGEFLKEGRIIKDSNKNQFAVTPDVAMQKMNLMRGDSTHPLNDPNHPSHEDALKEYDRYSEIAFAE